MVKNNNRDNNSFLKYPGNLPTLLLLKEFFLETAKKTPVPMSLNIPSANLDISRSSSRIFYSWQNRTLQTKREPEKIIYDLIVPLQSTCNHSPCPTFLFSLPDGMCSPVPNHKYFCKSNFSRYIAYFPYLIPHDGNQRVARIRI